MGSRRQFPLVLAVLVVLPTACTPSLASHGTEEGSGPVAPHPVASGAAASALERLPVKGKASTGGYSRAAFGQAWSDDVTVPMGHDGCDTRNNVLHAQLRDVQLKPRTNGCVVLAGTLQDPYTGAAVAYRRSRGSAGVLDVDHVVPLRDAWTTGAQELSERERRNLANDPANLLVVTSRVNRAKRDGDAATWLPPNRGYRCEYVARQIQVKTTYRLWVTAAERDAMRRVLASCPGQQLPATH